MANELFPVFEKGENVAYNKCGMTWYDLQRNRIAIIYRLMFSSTIVGKLKIIIKQDGRGRKNKTITSEDIKILGKFDATI